VAVFALDNAATHFQGAWHSLESVAAAAVSSSLKKSDFIGWLGNFQDSINALAGNDFLRFAASTWGSDKDDGAPSKVAAEPALPCLDMEMHWPAEGDL